jgi:hypothetical protein
MIQLHHEVKLDFAQPLSIGGVGMGRRACRVKSGSLVIEIVPEVV